VQGAPQYCNQPGCPVMVPFGQGAYCPKHKKEREADRRKNYGGGLYNAAWDRFCKALDSMNNTFCQRVHGGIRCREWVYHHHHVIEANVRPDLFYRWENVVGVCLACHPNPNDQDQGEFVPTLWREPFSGEAVPDIVVQPGAAVPSGFKLWSREERLRFFGGRNAP